MKIGNPLDKPGLGPVSNNRGDAAKAATETASTKASGSATGNSSTVALSSAATSLMGGSSADFDASKVDRISTAISQGQYTVNPEAIADKLIANAQELLSRPH